LQSLGLVVAMFYNILKKQVIKIINDYLLQSAISEKGARTQGFMPIKIVITDTYLLCKVLARFLYLFEARVH
jgi:hypothetical protein